jgi:predicted nucleic acid-binding protein
MKNRAEDITRYTFQATDALLLDANVWYLIYGPNRPDDNRVAVYSGALAKILAARSQIYIDVLIVSEFINRYARLKYNILRSSSGMPADFKQFRKSPAFKPIAQDIAADVKQVLKHCTRVESGFSVLDINALVDEYEKGDADFNDQVLTELCKSKGLTLVTDDADFKDRGLTIVTANRHLLTH